MQGHEEQVQELERLRWIHEASQLQYVTTLAWQAKQEAMLESVRVSIDRAGVLQVAPCGLWLCEGLCLKQGYRVQPGLQSFQIECSTAQSSLSTSQWNSIMLS